jgi:uncharacterized membrane protein
MLLLLRCRSVFSGLLERTLFLVFLDDVLDKHAKFGWLPLVDTVATGGSSLFATHFMVWEGFWCWSLRLSWFRIFEVLACEVEFVARRQVLKIERMFTCECI